MFVSYSRKKERGYKSSLCMSRACQLSRLHHGLSGWFRAAGHEESWPLFWETLRWETGEVDLHPKGSFWKAMEIPKFYLESWVNSFKKLCVGGEGCGKRKREEKLEATPYTKMRGFWWWFFLSLYLPISVIFFYLL